LKNNIIAAFGQLANGKDTLCDHMVEMLPKNENWKRSAFANAVKDTYCKTFNVTREFIEVWKRKEECPPGMLMNVRKGLQFVGDGFRQIVPSIWIDIALRTNDNVIISDGRYINEAKAVSERGGINILIYREGFMNDDPNPSEAQLKPHIQFCLDNNIQEGPIDLFNYRDFPEGFNFFNYFIINNGSKSNFLDKINSKLVPHLKSCMD
jgi:hypothetical protein